MRVLVTGGAGFIGSHLSDALLARGDEVAVLDDLSSGRLGRLDPQVPLHKLSITDAAALNDEVAAFGPELICHLAAQIDVRASVDAPAADAGVNILGTVNLLEAARWSGARVLFASTGGALYGRDAPIPSLEDVLPLPESPYGIAKYCAEQYIGLYNLLLGSRLSVLRLSNVYGPRQDPAGDAGVITIFCASALAGEEPTIYGDGTQTRDYVYVGDAVAAFLAAGDHGQPGTWNIGAGAEISVLDLVKASSRAPPRPPAAAQVRPPARPEANCSAAPSRRTAPPATSAGTRPPPWPREYAGWYHWIETGTPDRTPC